MFLTLYALLFIVIVIAYKKSTFAFVGLLTVFLILLSMTIYMVVRNLKSLSKGASLVNKGEAEKAIELFSRLLKISAKTAKAVPLAYRGMVYLRIRKFDLALRDLLESCKIKKLPLINIVRAGVVYTELKQYDRAHKYFLKAIELKPKSSSAYRYMGWFYLHTNQYEKAIENLNRAVKLTNGKLLNKSRALVTVYNDLCVTYTKLKEYDKAEEFLSKADEINTKASSVVVKADIYRSYVYLKKMMGDIKESRKYTLKTLRLDPYEIYAYKTLAEINLIEDDYEGFYKNFQIFLEKKALSIDEEDIEDVVYGKVKNEERFQTLILNNGINGKYDDLYTSINDEEILSSNLDTKQDGKNKKIIIGFIFLLVIEMINLLFISKQPIKIPKRTSEVKKTAAIDKIYHKYNMDSSKIIVNSPKFTVSWNKTHVKVGEKVKFNVAGIVQTAKPTSVKVLTVEGYGNKLVSDYAAQSDEITISNLKTVNNKIKSYIFIMPENEEKIYEYDFTLKLVNG